MAQMYALMSIFHGAPWRAAAYSNREPAGAARMPRGTRHTAAPPSMHDAPDPDCPGGRIVSQADELVPAAAIGDLDPGAILPHPRLEDSGPPHRPRLRRQSFEHGDFR